MQTLFFLELLNLQFQILLQIFAPITIDRIRICHRFDLCFSVQQHGFDVFVLFLKSFNFILEV
jgi:hypothetical protein